MKKTTLLLALVLALAAPAAAQEGWLVPFAAAYQPGLAGFRSAFSRHELPLPAERQFGWGVELRTLVNGFLLGPLYLRTWSDTETGEFHLRSEASAVMGEVGFQLSPAGWLSLIPMVGVGGLSQSLHLRSRTGELPLEELLGNPGQDAGIVSGLKFAGLAAIELGLAAPTESGRYGVAARIGYLYSPLDPTWHLANGSRITGAPRTGLRGPFLTLGLLIMPSAEVATSRL
ncbi:MAG: hypothetical protein R6X12_02640 [bacterium]